MRSCDLNPGMLISMPVDDYLGQMMGLAMMREFGHFDLITRNKTVQALVISKTCSLEFKNYFELGVLREGFIEYLLVEQKFSLF